MEPQKPLTLQRAVIEILMLAKIPFSMLNYRIIEETFAKENFLNWAFYLAQSPLQKKPVRDTRPVFSRTSYNPLAGAVIEILMLAKIPFSMLNYRTIGETFAKEHFLIWAFYLAQSPLIEEARTGHLPGLRRTAQSPNGLYCPTNIQPPLPDQRQ